MFPFINSTDLDKSSDFLFTEWTNINCALHCHFPLEIVIVLSGEFLIEKEDAAYLLKEKEMMLIMPFEVHRFTTKGSSKIAVFEISGNIFSGCRELVNKAPKNPVCKIDDSTISFVYEHLRQAEKHSFIEISAILYTLLSHFLRNSELQEIATPNDLFKEALIFISTHFEENITLKDVAKELNVSYVYLSRVFSEKSSLCFSDFINSFRLSKATAMLKNTDIPISEVCYSCGWGSLRNFNRVFLKEIGCTPKEFRKQKELQAPRSMS